MLCLKHEINDRPVWDAVIGSVRLRQGAFVPPPAAPAPVSSYSPDKAQAARRALDSWLYGPSRG